MAQRQAGRDIDDLPKNAANYTALTPLWFLERAALVHPTRVSVVHGSRRYTWRETYQRCRRLASAISNHSIGLACTVAVIAPNVPVMYEAHFGVPMAGAVVNAVNIRLNAATIAFLLNHSSASAVLVDQEFFVLAEEALKIMAEKNKSYKRPLLIVVGDETCDPNALKYALRKGAIDYEKFLETGDPDFAWKPPEDEWQSIALGYTSGTTSSPKGVVLHHRGAYLMSLGNPVIWGMNEGAVYLWTLPMFHCNGWCFTWTLAAVCGTSICLRQVTAKAVYSAIANHGVTHFCAAPVVLNTIVNAPAEETILPLPHVVHVMTAGAAPPPSVLLGMSQKGFRVTHTYGLSETYGPSTLCAWKPEWDSLAPETQARLNARQGVRYVCLEGLDVVNPKTMEPVPADGTTAGEIVFRGNVVMKGYLKNPKANEEAFANGWYHSGDIAGSTSFWFISLATLLCVSFCVTEGHSPFACDPRNGLTRNLRFCRAALPIHVRVQDLIGRLTLQEKVGLLVNNAAAVPRLGIRGYEWWSEALHGVSNTGPGVKFGGAFHGATSFPQVITTAASFNESLWEEIGRVVSDEARAMYNGGTAGLTYWSPNVNIFRDPRWGRGQETPGEDPVLSAKYAARYVRGLQGYAPGNRLKVAACCKHYTAYDLDNWKGVDRFHFNARVSSQDLQDTYNVPFEACVRQGKVSSVMCSYNQVNGQPTCANIDLLKNTIRGKWGLNGYIVSDCDSVQVLFESQHYTKSPEEAVADTIKAGLDLDCGPYLAVFTEGAVRRGLLKEGDVNNALANTITVQMRLGMFDGEPSAQPYGNLGPRDVCTPAHKKLALQAARQGIVLLKNLGTSLPLSTKHHRTVAVIGPNSDATRTMIGNYAGVPCGYTSPLQGIGRYARTIHQAGCLNVGCNGNQKFGAAEAAARQADATVLVMGLDQSVEAEARDRVGLLLPGYQQELITRVARASKGPTILVLMSGGPVDVSFANNDPRIGGIIWAGYPGQDGGAAIADVLFGATNPGGKLPMTWYPQSYLAKLSMTNMAMRADPSRGYPGRTYRFYKGPVVYHFGYGLSYTKFSHALAQAPEKISLPLTDLSALKNSTMLSKGVKVKHVNCNTESVGVHVDVKNSGSMDGTHTLLIFSTPPSGKGSSNKQLVSFKKVHLAAGSEQRVRIDIRPCKHLSAVDEFGIRRIPVGDHKLHIADLQHSISVQAHLPEIQP